jgi:hypothetical protein
MCVLLTCDFIGRQTDDSRVGSNEAVATGYKNKKRAGPLG